MFEEALPAKRRFGDSLAVKLLTIGFLILLLLIPLMMVRSLVAERQGRSATAAAEVAASWGGEQTLGGPVLTVPYRVRWQDSEGKTVETIQRAHFLPERLGVEGELRPERRRRGIFETVVYRAELRLAGVFRRPDLAGWEVAAPDVLWEKAAVSLGVPDPRGIRQGLVLRWGERELPLEPGSGDAGLWRSGVRTVVPGLGESAAGAAIPFSLALGLNGSGRLSVLPFGKETVVRLRSSWPHPSFAGAFLPEARTVTDRGFDAVWRVSWFGRSYPQQWRASDAESLASERAVAESAFGVELFLPADGYQKTERSLKYGILFIALTFLAFFLCETFNPFAVHAVQYLLIGFALCLFYLLLLSLSEVLPFGTAYALAAAATVLLIGAYGAAALRGWRRGGLVAGVLALLYGYLWGLLRAEDRSLLLGSVGLFLILALVMYLTRRIDWHAPRRGRGAVEGG
ncbi:MAG TPA: cell envelope integrity protein CreD [Thermoanaerobaculia bacterium]|nr:cell envelope integrity protein CreD [Thermoanaerobaculia bacterium]